MRSIVASELFAPIVGEEFAVARMSAVSTLVLLASIPGMLYKPLCDKFGRRIFLIINTLGIGLGTILIALSTNIPVYLVGYFVVAFFTPHDMQAIYIQECAPAKHRATIYSAIKAIATLGIFIVPLLRSIFIPGTDLSGWRYVYLVPGIITVLAAVAAFFLIKESDAFVETRLRQLRMTDEEIEAAKAAKNTDAQAQGGLVRSIKLAFRNKQIFWLMVSHGFIMWGAVIALYYEATLTNGYAQQFLAQGMDLEAARAAATGFVTQALLLFSAGSAIFQFFPGFLCGACVGSFWFSSDLVGLMISESTPTNLRASMMAVAPLITGVILVVGYGLILRWKMGIFYTGCTNLMWFWGNVLSFGCHKI